MRRPFALVAASVITIAGIAGLTGCATGDASASCSFPQTSSSSIDAITVNGKFGTKPTLDLPTPFKASSDEYAIIEKGSGTTTASGDWLTVDAAFFNATTGEFITGTDFVKGQATAVQLNDTLQPAFAKALTCVPVGSRVVTVLGNNAAIDEAFQLPEGTSVIGVFDVLDSYLGKANGAAQIVPDGFPMVVLADSGQPGVTFTASVKAPTDLRVAVLKQGDGATVTKNDTVVMEYSGWLWPTDGTGTTTQFDSSWGKGQPAVFAMNGGTISGFSDAIIGQKVGSQVAVIIPPSQGYGDKAQGAIPANSTLFFVIDILGVVSE